MKHGTLKISNAITGLSEFRHVMSAPQTAGSQVLAPITTTTRTTARIIPAAFPRSASLACSGSQEVAGSQIQSHRSSQRTPCQQLS